MEAATVPADEWSATPLLLLPPDVRTRAPVRLDLTADGDRRSRVDQLGVRGEAELAGRPAGIPEPRILRHVALAQAGDLGGEIPHAADLGGHLPRTVRILVRGLGSEKLSSPDFLSYLLFERPYIERLMDLGYEDGSAQWERIEPFLGGG